jgi:hypothetical protein
MDFNYAQKKRYFNAVIFKLLCGGFSQRRCAFELGLDRKTVVRKFIRMGRAAVVVLPMTHYHRQFKNIEFDDLETAEHSKCKPLSVTIALESKTRLFLGFRVSQMPAKGRLAHIAQKKYGYRADQRASARRSLFNELKAIVDPNAVIKSDQNPHYPPDVKEHFPNCRHETSKGRRGCVVGQGELKRGGFDPLFTLNHSYAMLRANINRLFRRTWCTTKKAERLSYHIALYALYHNLVLTQGKRRKNNQLPLQ